MSEKPSQYIEFPAARLRFVTRYGKKVLQQFHEWASLDLLNRGGEWRDVPLEVEDSNHE